jgi:hypothetical protein
MRHRVRTGSVSHNAIQRYDLGPEQHGLALGRCSEDIFDFVMQQSAPDFRNRYLFPLVALLAVFAVAWFGDLGVRARCIPDEGNGSR